MTIDLQDVAKAMRSAQSFQMGFVTGQFLTQPAQQGPSLFDIMYGGSRLNGQLSRLENILGKLNNTLDRLADILGGGNDYSIMPISTDGNSEWQSGWGGHNFVDEGTVISGSGRIWGDPHFIGADGGKYDVQGEAGKIYNLLSDDGFQMNGRFDDWGGNGATVVGEVGINAKGDQITVDGDGNVSVNGEAVGDGETVALTNGGYVTKNGKEITVESGEWKVEFDAKSSSRGNYLNMDVSTENAVADGVKPHGLLGQTFDGDGVARNGDKGKGAQGGGAIEELSGLQTQRGDKQAVAAYEVDSLTDTDFNAFNRYTDILGTVSFVEEFDDFFAAGFYTGTNLTSDNILDAVNDAYGSLAMSLMGGSTGMFGWSFYQFGETS